MATDEDAGVTTPKPVLEYRPPDPDEPSPAGRAVLRFAAPVGAVAMLLLCLTMMTLAGAGMVDIMRRPGQHPMEIVLVLLVGTTGAGGLLVVYHLVTVTRKVWQR